MKMPAELMPTSSFESDPREGPYMAVGFGGLHVSCVPSAFFTDIGPQRPYVEQEPNVPVSELQQLSRAVRMLYEGALDPKRWPEFLRFVCKQLKGKSATLLLPSPNGVEPGPIYTWGCKPEHIAAYTNHYFALDPFAQLPTGKVFTMHELVPREQRERSEFVRNFPRPIDAEYSIGVDISEQGSRGRFRVGRSARTGDFSDADRRFCEALVQHLQAAIRTYAEVNRLRVERAVYAQAMDNLSLGTIILDESGRVLHTNALARQILVGCDGISLTGTTLVLCHPDDAQRFKAAVVRMSEARRAGKAGVAEVIRVQHPSGRPALSMIVRPAPMDPGEQNGAMTPAVAVFLSAEYTTRDASVECVQKLFGLTQKEAMLALSLTSGRTLQQAANEMNITPNTARAHIRAIFAKTGIDRQTKLVAAILRSAALLG